MTQDMQKLYHVWDRFMTESFEVEWEDFESLFSSPLIRPMNRIREKYADDKRISIPIPPENSSATKAFMMGKFAEAAEKNTIRFIKVSIQNG